MISRVGGPFHGKSAGRTMRAEVPVPRRTVSLVLLVLFAAVAWAQGAPSPDLCRAVARAWSLPSSEVESLAAQSGADLQNLAVTAALARATGKSIGEAWAIHGAEPTWAEAFAKAGSDPSEVIAGVEGRVSLQTWTSLLGRGEPVAMAALVRTLERLSGRAPEPLARELARKPFDLCLAELAGVKGGSAASAPASSQTEDLGPTPEPREPVKLVMPLPGLQPELSGFPPPPASVDTTPK